MNHAAKRAMTRYGMELLPADEREIINRIKEGKGKRLSIRTGGTDESKAERWRVLWPRLGRDVVVIYLAEHDKLATFLPNSRMPRYREIEPMEIDDEHSPEPLDVNVLASLSVSFLAPHVSNPLMQERLREAGLK